MILSFIEGGDEMDKQKMKASEYAQLIGVSLNTVKNRIRAGVLEGAKEEDGIWYVYISPDEYEHIIKSNQKKEEREAQLKETLEKLKGEFEGNLIATYIEIQRLQDIQKEELFHEISSLSTLLAVKEREIDFLKREKEQLIKNLDEKKAEVESLKEELKRLKEEIKTLETKLRQYEHELASKDIEIQRVILEKDRDILNKDMEIEKLKSKLGEGNG